MVSSANGSQRGEGRAARTAVGETWTGVERLRQKKLLSGGCVSNDVAA